MKVQDAINYLSQTYKADDELFIVWWDKETGEAYADSELTNEQWSSVVKQLDEDEHLFWSVNDTITELANNEVN